ncbi:hypothetical protein GGX14DRAFT_563388 [Mycena pura]|uniref:Uncharacterized protein n=1 Tax=Mycena pura TaxID=153505 RepID=A0AAD6YJ93_9AGAR|nr:hypothetical protein GGX14DRAFT_563388 [Mycena pura]
MAARCARPCPRPTAPPPAPAFSNTITHRMCITPRAAHAHHSPFVAAAFAHIALSAARLRIAPRAFHVRHLPLAARRFPPPLVCAHQCFPPFSAASRTRTSRNTRCPRTAKRDPAFCATPAPADRAVATCPPLAAHSLPVASSCRQSPITASHFPPPLPVTRFTRAGSTRAADLARNVRLTRHLSLGVRHPPPLPRAARARYFTALFPLTASAATARYAKRGGCQWSSAFPDYAMHSENEYFAR